MNKFLGIISLATSVLVSCNKTNKETEIHKIVEKKQIIDTSVHTTPLVLWFTQPAYQPDSVPYLHNGSTNIHGDAEGKGWDEALPIGNGHMAAMVFGGTRFERLQLNEESIWSYPTVTNTNFATPEDIKEIQNLVFAEKYADAQALVEQKLTGNSEMMPKFQPLSDLMLEMTDIDESQVTDYYRDLHIDSAIATVHFHIGEKLYTREVFASFPDKVIVMKLSCNVPNSINTKISLLREAEAETFRSPFDTTLLIQRGQLSSNGIKFETQVKAVYKGGSVRNDTKKLIAKDVDELYIYISAASSTKGETYALDAKTNLLNAIAKPYSNLREEHFQDYKSVFSRVELNLNFKDKAYDIPTNQRVEKVKNGTEDKYLTELLFQYGRYLVIASSRGNALPPNMQGIWNEHLSAVDGSGYKIPFSLPFMYSFVEETGLADLKTSLFNDLEKSMPNAKLAAKNIYNVDGAAIFDRIASNGSVAPTAHNLQAASPMGLVWLSKSLYESYAYSSDKENLKTVVYPILKQASLFVCNTLVEVPQNLPLAGKLVVCPSFSMANSFEKNGENFKVGYASVLDQSLVRDLLKNTLNAIDALSSSNYKFDPAHKTLLETSLAKLAMPTDTITDFKSQWLSGVATPVEKSAIFPQLYQVFPSNGFNFKLSEQSKLLKSLKEDILANVSKTGMTYAYAAIILARMKEASLADDMLLEHLRNSVSTNLLASNPPFSMEGNCLFTTAVNNMLMQCLNDEIQFTPALPPTWEEGNFKGFRAKGGFTANVEWKGSKVYATLLSTKGNVCKIRSRYKLKVFSAGSEVEVNKNEKDLYTFATSAGASYTITYSNSGTKGESKGMGIWPDLGINLGLGI